MPIRSTPRPNPAKKSGKIPQLMPSLRLLTSPACDAANRLRSPNEARRKICQKPTGSSVACVPGDLQADVMAGIPDEQDRQNKPKDRIADAKIEGFRPQTVALGDVAGEKGRDADGEIARELIEAHGEPARFGPDEVDLHDDRHRPGEALADAQQARSPRSPSPSSVPSRS